MSFMLLLSFWSSSARWGLGGIFVVAESVVAWRSSANGLVGSTGFGLGPGFGSGPGFGFGLGDCLPLCSTWVATSSRPSWMTMSRMV